MVGSVLAIGWVIFLNAARRSLGPLGILLVVGLSWSHLSRRLTGQVDADVVD